MFPHFNKLIVIVILTSVSYIFLCQISVTAFYFTLQTFSRSTAG